MNAYLYVVNNPTNFIDPAGEIGLPGAIVGAVSGFVGGYVTSGNFTGAMVGAGVGAFVGFWAPTASYKASTIATYALLNGAANLGGQLFGAAFSKCDGTYWQTFSKNFSWATLFGATLAGAFGPFFSEISHTIFNGSLIIEGMMGGLYSAYNEVSFNLLSNVYF